MDVNALSYIALIALIQGVICAFFIRSTFRKKLELNLKFNSLLLSALVGSCLNAALTSFQLIFKMDKLFIEEFGMYLYFFVGIPFGLLLQFAGTYFSIKQFLPETSVVEKNKLMKILTIGILKAAPIVILLEITFSAILLS